MMPSVVKLHIAAVACLTGVQWLMFSVNALWGVAGLTLLTVWGLLGGRRPEMERSLMYAVVAGGIAAMSSYIPMIATLFGRSLWPG